MGQYDRFNLQTQNVYFSSSVVNTLSTEPILKSSKSAFEKKGNDELRGGVWAQPKRHQTCRLDPVSLKIQSRLEKSTLL